MNVSLSQDRPRLSGSSDLAETESLGWGGSGVWGGFQMLFPRLFPSSCFNVCFFLWKEPWELDMHDWWKIFDFTILLDFVLGAQREMDDMRHFWRQLLLFAAWDCDPTPCTWCTGTLGGQASKPCLVDASLKETFLDGWLMQLWVICLWFRCVFLVCKTLQTNMMYDGWVKVLKSEHFLHVDVEGWFMLGSLQICLVCSDAFINLKPLHQISSKPVYSNYFEILFFRKIDGNGPLLVILKISLDQKRHELPLFWASCKAPTMLQKSKTPCISRCYKNGCYKCKLMSCKSDLSLHLFTHIWTVEKKWHPAFKVTSWSPNIGPGTWPNLTMASSWFLRQPHPSDAQCSGQVSSTDSWWNRQESPEKSGSFSVTKWWWPHGSFLTYYKMAAIFLFFVFSLDFIDSTYTL